MCRGPLFMLPTSTDQPHFAPSCQSTESHSARAAEDWRSVMGPLRPAPTIEMLRSWRCLLAWGDYRPDEAAVGAMAVERLADALRGKMEEVFLLAMGEPGSRDAESATMFLAAEK